MLHIGEHGAVPTFSRSFAGIDINMKFSEIKLWMCFHEICTSQHCLIIYTLYRVSTFFECGL